MHIYSDCLWNPGFSFSAFLIRHHTLLTERTLVSDSFLFISLLSSLELCFFRENRKRNHTFFHFCPLVSAVSTTTVAENIPQKDSANGVGCCLGSCSIGVSGVSCKSLCILDVCVYVGGQMEGAACTRLHACIRACLYLHMMTSCGWALQDLFVCQKRVQSFHGRDEVTDERKWLSICNAS